MGWLIAAALYVVVMAAFSVAPLRAALLQAQGPAASPTVGHERSAGPLHDAPDSPGLRLAKAVGARAALIVGPPLLALWFGWDVWFAVVGFLKPKSGRP